MSKFVIFEDAAFAHFLPLTYWRPVMELRCGRKTLIDNAAFAMRQHIGGVWTRGEVADVAALRLQIPANQPISAGTVLINARWLIANPPTFHAPPYVARCGEAIAYIACDERLAAALTPEKLLAPDALDAVADCPTGELDLPMVSYPWDLVERNADTLRRHWTGDDRGSNGNVSSSAFMLNPDQIHVGDRTRIRPTAVIDAGGGPVFISNDVRVDVHTYIEGPAYIGPGSVIKPFCSVRAGTSLGPMSKVGGEISATITSGFVNKQHEGFLGHACVGSWVNLGAGTTNSNLKNTYGPITVRMGADSVATGRQFVGAVIGDFVRTGLGQLLPTGAVVGFGAMVANGGFSGPHVPSYTWMTTDGVTSTDPEKLREIAARIMARRRVELTTEEAELFAKLPELTQRYGV
jgi:UDP-N-acetylglucosamine diphosphorylase/glucosamine-1-phosphate N-acetyltransferase